MSEDIVEVRLLALPVPLWREAAAHVEAIQREFDIIRANQPEESVPNRLLTLIRDNRTRFSEFTGPSTDALEAAAEQGAERIDLVYRVPREVMPAARRLRDMLDEVDEFCRQGEELLTLATPPHLRAFREWFLEEFERQGAGEPPLPWDEYPAGTEVPQPPGRPDPAISVREASAQGGEPTSRMLEVTGDLDLATAGAVRDELQRLHNQGVDEIVLDLSGVGFMDSVGISLLVNAHTRLVEEGRHLRLLVPGRLRRLLELTGLGGVLDIEQPAD